jgi:phosphohistidine phosphatase
MERPAHTLILLRHAKSDWSGGEPDHERPLAERGRRQAPEAGRWLAEHAGPIDLAVVSPAARARSTWTLASAELADPPAVRLDDRVYGASSGSLLGVVRDLPEDLATVVLVGHNPGLEDLASTLADAWVAMPTSALAVLAVTGPWAAAGPASVTLTASGRRPR